MARKEPRFDLSQITNMRMPYPSRPYRDIIIKKESMMFKKNVENMLEKNNIHVTLNIEKDVFVCQNTV